MMHHDEKQIPQVEYIKPEAIDLGAVTSAIGGSCVLPGDVYTNFCSPGGSPVETCSPNGDAVST